MSESEISSDGGLSADGGEDREVQKTAIRAHEEPEGMYYCWYDDPKWDWNPEAVEHLFYQCDDEKRVTDSLTIESDREENAPVVGHVEHREGEIERITFDLTEWYGDDATFEFDELPDLGGGIE